MSDFVADFLRGVLGVVSEKLDDLYLTVGETLGEVDAALAGFPPIEDEPVSEPEPVQDETDNVDAFWEYKLKRLIDSADRRWGKDNHYWRNANLDTQAGRDGVSENFHSLVTGQDGWTAYHAYGE